MGDITTATLKALHDRCQDLIDGISYSVDDPNADLHRMNIIAHMAICGMCRFLISTAEEVPVGLRLVWPLPQNRFAVRVAEEPSAADTRPLAPVIPISRNRGGTTNGD